MFTEDYKREFISILFRQKRTVFIVTLIIFVFSLLIAFYWPPTYSATGSILLRWKRAEKAPTALEQVASQVRRFPLTEEDLVSEQRILTSPDLIMRTLKRINKNETITEEEVYRVQNKLRTQIIPASNVIEVTFYDRNPKKAMQVLQVLLDEYIAYRTQVYGTGQIEGFFSQQSDRFKKELEKKEEELISLVSQNGTPDPKMEIENNLARKKDLQEELNTLENSAIEKKLLIAHLDNALADKNIKYFSSLGDNTIIGNLATALEGLTIEQAKVLSVYTPSSEKAKITERKVNNTFQLLKDEVLSYRQAQLNQLNAIKEKIDRIRKEIDRINEKNVQLQRQIIDSQRIERDVDLLQYSYKTFSQRREEARIEKAISKDNISTSVCILNKAFPSSGPVFPKKQAVIPLGLVVGLIVGLSLGFVYEYFDHTFKKPSDVSKYAEVPVIFSIPFSKRIGKTK